MDAKSAHQQQYKVHKSPKHVKTHPQIYRSQQIQCNQIKRAKKIINKEGLSPKDIKR